jgi:predicted metal-dependent hydrolase
MMTINPGADPEDLVSLQRGAEEFNAGKFFECHDTLEETWQGVRGPARNFFQGLIQISVGFYHLGNGNLVGGESQLAKGLKNLEGYGDDCLRVDLVNLRREVGTWLETIRRGEKPQGKVSDLPKIRFVT